MMKQIWRPRPIFTFPQILIIFAVFISLFVLLDYNRQSEAGEAVGADRDMIQQAIDAEQTRVVQLEATLEYVRSEDYIASYARNEAGYILPGEERVVPVFVEATPAPTLVPTPTPDPVTQARPWQAWWRLMTDAPLPTD